MGKIGDFFFNAQVFPLILAFTVLGVLFVLFRMNNVEMDYKTAFVERDIEKKILENKELKAQKAKLLSTGTLRRLAKKHRLARPQQKQIIIIP